MTKIEIEVKLSDEDRKLLTAVNTNLTKAAAKAAPAATGTKPTATKPKPATKPVKVEEPVADATDEFEGASDESGDGGEDGGDAGDEFEGETAPEETVLDRSDVHAALRAYADAVGSQAEAIKLMSKFGGTDALSKLPEAKFKSVIDAANAAAKKAKK